MGNQKRLAAKESESHSDYGRSPWNSHSQVPRVSRHWELQAESSKTKDKEKKSPHLRIFVVNMFDCELFIHFSFRWSIVDTFICSLYFHFPFVQTLF